MTTDTKLPKVQLHYNASEAIHAVQRAPWRDDVTDGLDHARHVLDELRVCAAMALNDSTDRADIERRLWQLIAPPANVVPLPTAAPVDDGLHVYRLPSGWRVGRRNTNGVQCVAGPFGTKHLAEDAMKLMLAQGALPC